MKYGSKQIRKNNLALLKKNLKTNVIKGKLKCNIKIYIEKLNY